MLFSEQSQEATQPSLNTIFLLATHRGRMAQAVWTSPKPNGFGGKDDPRIDRLEIWATNIRHKGPDYCEARVFSSDGKLLGSARVPGY